MLRCVSSLRGGLHQGPLGSLGRAGSLHLLSGHGCGCVPHGHHQEHLGVLHLLCGLQSHLHAADNHRYVSRTDRHPDLQYMI